MNVNNWGNNSPGKHRGAKGNRPSGFPNWGYDIVGLTLVRIQLAPHKVQHLVTEDYFRSICAGVASNSDLNPR